MHEAVFHPSTFNKLAKRCSPPVHKDETCAVPQHRTNMETLVQYSDIATRVKCAGMVVAWWDTERWLVCMSLTVAKAVDAHMQRERALTVVCSTEGYATSEGSIQLG